MPELHYLGVTQKRTPLAIRERIPTDRDSQLALLSALSEFAVGRVVLATCERLEIYASQVRANIDTWTRFLVDWFRLPAVEFTPHLEIVSGHGVAEHLLRVAAGLESRIVGERQILGQVRNAHANALEQRSLDAQLSQLLRTAIRVGKRVRHETTLDRGGRSIATLAMEWLGNRGESPRGKTVSILGSGRLAGLIASQIACQKPEKLMIIGRNHTRAALLAEQFHATCHEFSKATESIDQSDLVFACTASPVFVVVTDHVKDRKKPLQLIDLCVPRNIDPAVAALPNISLTHLDSLVSRETGFAANAMATNAVLEAESLVNEELQRFLQWRQERRVAPLIADLLSRAARSPCSTGGRVLHEQIMRLKAGAAL